MIYHLPSKSTYTQRFTSYSLQSTLSFLPSKRIYTLFSMFSSHSPRSMLYVLCSMIYHLPSSPPTLDVLPATLFDLCSTFVAMIYHLPSKSTYTQRFTSYSLQSTLSFLPSKRIYTLFSMFSSHSPRSMLYVLCSMIYHLPSSPPTLDVLPAAVFDLHSTFFAI